jgi:histidine triad (HIT) family protein
VSNSSDRPCLFCKIVSGEASSHVVYRDDLVLAFHDTRPIASTHILIIPNRHLDSVNDLEPGDAGLIGHMVLVAKQIAAEQGISQSGYRLIMNTGADAGQTIRHLHLHLIAGRLARFRLG